MAGFLASTLQVERHLSDRINAKLTILAEVVHCLASHKRKLHQEKS